MTELKTVAIDLDETLIDSKAFILKFIKGAFEHLGKTMPPEVEKHAFSMDEKSFIKHYFTQDNDLERFLEYRSRVDLEEGWHEFDAKPNATAFIDALRGKYKLAIATNRAESSIKVLKRFGWYDAFDVIVHAGTIPYAKPDPQVLEYVLEQTGVQKQEAVMIGDSAYDAGAAENAGLVSIIVNTVEEGPGDFRIKDLLEALPLLDNWDDTLERAAKGN